MDVIALYVFGNPNMQAEMDRDKSSGPGLTGSGGWKVSRILNSDVVLSQFGHKELVG